MKGDITRRLEQRLGRLHARQRLGIEKDSEAHFFGHGIGVFHLENWYSLHSVIAKTLKLTGLYWRGQRNAAKVRVRRNDIGLKGLPGRFDGFTILQISDLHVELSPGAMQRLLELLVDIECDLCVLTGDYRASTFGPIDAAMEGLARMRAVLKSSVYGILGNHDSISMVPGMEDMGIKMLLNESEPIERDGHRFHLAGIDDAHYYRVDNIEKAAEGIPHDEISILLSHTPEIYRQAAYADFDAMLCGHTHGGQICLPGSIPITLEAVLPRKFGSGPWRYNDMTGYTSLGVGTSIVPVRFNCPPEITLHRLLPA